MRFVRYQSFRNRMLGFFAIIGTTVGGFFGYQSMSNSDVHVAPTTLRSERTVPRDHAPPATATAPTHYSGPAEQVTQQAAVPQVPQLTKAQRYVLAMKFAHIDSRRVAKAKDVLGSRNPWKLNLYDDNRDGQWDRGKLDTNRDDVDDETWTFKNGYWEKDSGRLAWSDDQWVKRSSLVAKAADSTDQKLALYRAAFTIANARANASGKGKDVLGASSPWKLNLYDDDKDGKWDRGKLDTNRDEVDDEKWTFKKGRWEKDGGSLVWANNHWVKASSLAAPQSPTNTLDRYQAAFKIASERADSSGKGKDVLGSKSPCKLNLYDDNRDGQWDRAKLDTNRDEVDDEKWTFKKDRWEKEGGSKIWTGDRWESAPGMSAEQEILPNADRYREAMQLANGRANSSGKGKDVLGAGSPWKLNLYDDNRDGRWERGKLDTNRDGVDDEKWNFKNGRWEKDGGASIWDGKNWIGS